MSVAHWIEYGVHSTLYTSEYDLLPNILYKTLAKPFKPKTFVSPIVPIQYANIHALAQNYKII